jgi:hypothetical protein
MFRTCRRLLALALLVTIPGCLLDDPDTPELEGPSTLGHAIDLLAHPDQLVADGWSSAVIEAVLRDPNSNRIAGATIFFDIQGFVDQGNLAPLNGPRPTYGGVEATQVTAVTDGDGVARVRYWAPFRTDQPDDDTVTILAREGGTNFRQALGAAGQTDIFLRAADRPIPGPIPIPSPGCDAPTADLALSGLCSGGEIRSGANIFGIGSASEAGDTGAVITTYIFNWGDGSSEVSASPTVSHRYSGSLNGSSVTVTLTVVNSCGGSASAAEEAEIVPVCP